MEKKQNNVSPSEYTEDYHCWGCPFLLTHWLPSVFQIFDWQKCTKYNKRVGAVGNARRLKECMKGAAWSPSGILGIHGMYLSRRNHSQY